MALSFYLWHYHTQLPLSSSINNSFAFTTFPITILCMGKWLVQCIVNSYRLFRSNAVRWEGKKKSVRV